MKWYLLFLISNLSLTIMASQEPLYTESIVLESIKNRLENLRVNAQGAALSASLTYYFLNKYLDNTRLTTHNKLIRKTLHDYGFSESPTDSGNKPLFHARIAHILHKNKDNFQNSEEARRLLKDATIKEIDDLYKKIVNKSNPSTRLYQSLALMTIEESIRSSVAKNIEETEVQKIFINHELSDGITHALHAEILEVMTPQIFTEIIEKDSSKKAHDEDTF